MKSHESITALLSSVRAALHVQQEQAAQAGAMARPPTAPFVTVSRQAGAGGRTFARLLAERLNALDPGPRPWAVWDRELVEKVAADHHIPESLVEHLGEGHRSPLEQLAVQFAVGADAATMDEHQVYRRVAQTVRGLARAGRAVIVGRGGVYATDDLPGGVHVRLVAPLAQRVRHMAGLLKVPEGDAAAEVDRLDRQREALHRRFWHAKALSPEVFTVTLNTAAVGDEQLVDCVLPLIRARAKQPAANAGARVACRDEARESPGGCRNCRPAGAGATSPVNQHA